MKNPPLMAYETPVTIGVLTKDATVDPASGEPVSTFDAMPDAPVDGPAPRGAESYQAARVIERTLSKRVSPRSRSQL